MADKPKPAAKQASPLKDAYLILYNFASAVAWSVVLGRTLAVLYLRGPAAVYAVVGEWTKWTQTAAVMEILHSLLGVVRAPVSTTVMQVFSRLLLVWPVVNTWPFLALSPFYTSMLVAWSVTEVVRYSYFALSLAGALPSFLTWLRYSMFYILYPMGITSECMLVYAATGPAAERSSFAPWALYAILAIYVPGSYVLFTHMMKQRSKVLRSSKAKKGDKAQ
ncbi:protein tyrosine phosphatase-like protein [Metarhizium brunneum]